MHRTQIKKKSTCYRLSFRIAVPVLGLVLNFNVPVLLDGIVRTVNKLDEHQKKHFHGFD